MLSVFDKIFYQDLLHNTKFRRNHNWIIHIDLNASQNIQHISEFANLYCVLFIFAWNLIWSQTVQPGLLLIFCCIIFELIIWNPTQLVNSPVFFFRCPLCSRWIGYCISALLGCVCECKAAVLYNIKLITIQLVCTYLPPPVCAHTVGIFILLKLLCWKETDEGSQSFSVFVSSAQ